MSVIRLFPPLLSLLLISAAATATPVAPADIVLKHGSVYTVDNDLPWAEAVAVSGGRIVYVGREPGVAPYIGKQTRVIDMGGGMLLPGFIDSHAHIGTSESLFDASLTLRGRPPAEVIAVLKRYVEANPQAKMILGGGWIYEAFLPEGPTRQMIDPFIPDRPAVLKAIDGHHAWVNSKALELAGITAQTPDPLPGKSWFQRDPRTHEPTGFIVEQVAMEMLKKALIDKGYAFETRERLAKGLERAVPMLAAAGITAMFDAGMKDPKNTFDLLNEMQQRGALSVRVFGSYVFRPDLHPGITPEDAIEGFRALQRQYHTEYLGVQMIKTYLDGTETNHTAFMLEPFTDRPGFPGEPLIAQPQLNDLLQKADLAGIDVHIHVVGDAGARSALDAIEFATRQNPPRDRRHTLAHTILVDPHDIPRFRELGAVWQTTPAWAVMNDRNRTVERIVGETRFSGIYPLQDAIDQGVVVTGGSDNTSLNPGIIYRPLDQIEIGHNRQPIDHPEERIMPRPDQRVNLPDLIRSYTLNSAYMLHREQDIGSIRVGKKADLALLEKNLFAVPRHDIHAVRVMLTMMDGKVTHSVSTGVEAAQ
jgi:predicted amidohydrolase YtcJ